MVKVKDVITAMEKLAPPALALPGDPIGLHSGAPNQRIAKVALALMTTAAAMRVLPELGVGSSTFGLHYALAAGLWSASFATWLIGFWPILNDPRRDEGGCG